MVIVVLSLIGTFNRTMDNLNRYITAVVHIIYLPSYRQLYLHLNTIRTHPIVE